MHSYVRPYKQKCKVVSINLAHPVDVNRLTDDEDMRKNDFWISFPVNLTFYLDFKFAPKVFCTTFRFRINRKHGTDKRTRTDGRTLNVTW